jgi:hypothetical protein
MKLLLAILLFSGIADASAQTNTVVHDTDGRYWVLLAQTVQTTPSGAVAGAYEIAGVGGVLAFAKGCPSGRGTLSMKLMALKDTPTPYLDKPWSYNGSGVYDRLAIALCAEGISK